MPRRTSKNASDLAQKIITKQKEKHDEYFASHATHGAEGIRTHKGSGFDWFIFPSYSNGEYKVYAGEELGREVYSLLTDDHDFIERYHDSIIQYFFQCRWDVVGIKPASANPLFKDYPIRFYKLMESFVGITAGNTRKLSCFKTQAEQDKFFLNIKAFADATNQVGNDDLHYKPHYNKLGEIVAQINKKKQIEDNLKAKNGGVLLTSETIKKVEKTSKAKTADGLICQVTTKGGRSTQEDALIVGLVNDTKAKDNPQEFLRREVTEAVQLHNDYNSGTTVTGAIVRNKDGKVDITTANLGDSRTAAVIKARNKTTGNVFYKSIQLTQDANPDTPRFKDQIESVGGFVRDSRVAGNIAMAASVGDADLAPWLIQKPEIQNFSATDFVGADEEIIDLDLVVSCDGLWEHDVLKVDEEYVLEGTNWKKQKVTNAAADKTLSQLKKEYDEGAKKDTFAMDLVLHSSGKSGDNISVISSSLIKDGNIKVSSDKPLMALVCDGHGNSNYYKSDDDEMAKFFNITRKPEANGWVPASSVVAQLSVAAQLQEIQGMEVNPQNEPLLHAFREAYQQVSGKKSLEVKKTQQDQPRQQQQQAQHPKPPSPYAQYKNATETAEEIESKPNTKIKVKLMQNFTSPAGVIDIWKKDENKDRGDAFRAYAAAYKNQSEMIHTFNRILFAAAYDAKLSPDEVKIVFEYAKKHGGVSNILDDQTYKNNPNDIAEKFIFFSQRCQELAESCGLYTGRKSDENLKKPLVGCRLTFFPYEAYARYNEIASASSQDNLDLIATRSHAALKEKSQMIKDQKIPQRVQ